MQGWLKYLEITEDVREVPTTFIKNSVFFLQSNDNPGINTISKDNIGYVNIPNEDYHFFKLCENDLKIFTARNDKYKTFKKSFNLKDLIPLLSTVPCKGGVEDVGNFEEGYCFMLKFINYSAHIIWELCADDIVQKTKWMDMIIKQATKDSGIVSSVGVGVTPTASFSSPFVKVPPVIPVPTIHSAPLTPIVASGISQHVNPSYGVPIPPVTAISPPPGSVYSVPAPGSVYPVPPPGSIYPTPPPNTVYPLPPPGTVVPGVVEWSPCSRPCGGGIQTRPTGCTQKDYCKMLEERMCNIQACKEEIEQSLEKLKKVSQGQWELLGTWSPCSRTCGGGVQTIQRRCIGDHCEGDTLLVQNCNSFVCAGDPNKMVISVAEVFNRNSFDECKLLEGNLMMVINNERVLSHVEVDRQNVQIFSETNPNVPITIPLNQLLDISPAPSSPSCFTMVDALGKSTLLCPQQPIPNACDLWVSRIKDFKYNCAKKLLGSIETDITASLKNNEDPINKISRIQNKAMEEENIKTAIKEKTLDIQFEEFKRQTRDLLSKEDEYEVKLEQQEKDRIEMETQMIQEAKKREEESARRLLNDIQTLAQNDASYKMKEQSIKKEMKDMMDEVQGKISQKREKLVSKLNRMRTIKDLNEKKAAKELMDVKREIGQKMANMSKQGNISQCLTKNPALIEGYCTANIQSLEMQIECKKPNQFCYMCCETEIGAINKDNLTCCYNKCDNIASNTCMTFDETYIVNSTQVAMLK
jgi:hypothetical protein